jgi:GNAT superfamily N-acetyltransferase
LAYELKHVASAGEWRAMHDLRRSTLFAPGRHGDEIIYDDNHPDDHHPDNWPFLLLLDGAPIGVVRLDQRGDHEGVVRLVAIAPALQRHGHGRRMSELVDAAARQRGMRRLVVNAHRSAVEFYRCTGWHEETWDVGELVGIAADCVQMAKSI